jgi:inner membrane protein
VELRSNHPSPSFQGGWLPGRRTVGNSGFSASWSVPSLGRNYGQAWEESSDMQSLLEGSKFGVELIEPTDQYHMAERSTKYASLFIALTFAAIWLMEVLAGLKVHPIQYLMLGGALCLFYLLELSLAEHLGFHRAYALASCSVVLMLAAHCVTVLRRAARAVAVGIEAIALYGFLYILLTNEDYALLIGSIGLFAILGLAMFLTRKVDWYAVGQPSAPRSGESPSGG